MVKEIKRKSQKISKKAILSCMIITSITVSNCSMVKALDTNSNSVTTTMNQEEINGQHKFFIDAPLKTYEDIDKAEMVAGFKFKVPDYIPNGDKFDCFHIRKLTENDNAVQIFFDGEDQVPFDITLQVSKTNHQEALKKIETAKIGTTKNPKVETSEEAMTLGDINGTSFSLSITSPSEKLENGYVTEEFTELNKYFIWENEGLYYSVKYSSIIKRGEKTSKRSLNLSEDIIEKIAESIKYPEEIKNIDYSVPKRELSTEVATLVIYDKDDLENAKKLLGFNPKFPLKINDYISITGSDVGISYDSDIENNKINYELNSFYSNQKGSITFLQGKTSKKYEEIKKNGYRSLENWKTKEVMQLKADKLNINNKEVFRYEEKGIEEGQGSSMTYIWKEDGVYYSVIFFKNIENSDELVKAFVNSSSIN